MDNFDKIFSDKLQETQEFDFQETDWQEVSDRLDMHAPVATASWKKAIVPLIMLSLLGAVGLLWLKLDNTNSELQQLKENLFERTLRDTVIQTIVLRDTIFASENQNSNINTHDISWVGKPVAGVVNPFLSLGDNLAKNINQTFSSHSFLYESLNSKIPQLGVQGRATDVFDQMTEAPDYLPGLTPKGVKQEEHNPILIARNAPLNNYPGFQLLGAQVGLVVGKSFIPNNQLTAVSSANWGLKAEFLLLNNLRLVAGLDFYNLKYEAQSDFLGREIPLPEDPTYLSEDLIFSQSTQNFTQLQLGLKYVFPTELSVLPYVGLNYFASAKFNKEFYYLYDPAIYSLPEFETTFQNTDITGNGFGIDLGIEYQAKDWLSIQFETYYHLSNRRLESLYHDLLGVRTAVLFRF